MIDCSKADNLICIAEGACVSDSRAWRMLQNWPRANEQEKRASDCENELSRECETLSLFQANNAACSQPNEHGRMLRLNNLPPR